MTSRRAQSILSSVLKFASKLNCAKFTWNLFQYCIIYSTKQEEALQPGSGSRQQVSETVRRDGREGATVEEEEAEKGEWRQRRTVRGACSG